MTFRDAGYWHGKGKFVKENAAELLGTIARNDDRSSRSLSFQAQRDLKALDDSLVFFIELVQLIYKNRENWQGNTQIRASVAMVNATLNYFFLARRSAILGYGAESQMLYRGCFERMTRAVVFQVDRQSADRFWRGAQISQSEVNDKISRYLESKNEKALFKEILQSYKNIWKILSELSHPNLETIKLRMLSIEGRSLNDSLGLDVGLGGMPNENVISSITALITHVTFSLSLMRILVDEFLSKWNRKLDKKYSRLMQAGFEVPLSELERQVDLLEQFRP